MSSDNRGSTAGGYPEEAAGIIGDIINHVADSVEDSVYGARDFYRTMRSGVGTILDEGFFPVARDLIREGRSRSRNGSGRHDQEEAANDSDEGEGNDQHDSRNEGSTYRTNRYERPWNGRDQRFSDGGSQSYLGVDGRYGQHPSSPSREHQRTTSASPGYEEARQSFYEGQRHPTSLSQGDFSQDGTRPATGRCTQCSKTDAPWKEAVEAKFFDDDNGRRRVTTAGTEAGYRCYDC